MNGSDYFIEPLTQREVEILELLAEGLSNREIAQRLFIANGTVKWYNKQIYSKLNVNNRKQAVAKAKQASLLRTEPEKSKVQSKTIKHNLPSHLTSFIGREREINEVMRLLETTRLLTLTGPPGTGKTRLGIRVAEKILNQFEDGVYYIELAPISDPELVISTIAQEFNLRETAEQQIVRTLKNYLQEKRLLLLIDNFEQVIDAAPLVGELLSASPGAKALVTSREALRIYGEQEYTVPPLALPDPVCKEPLRVLSQYEAVDLFSQRARGVNPGFELTEENVISVSEICVHLDGLPLAIELAAARSKLLSPESIRARLDSRLMTLKGGARDLPARLQTLRAAVDWSYDLLEPVEKRLFDRMAVFQGGRSEEAVAAICGPGLEIDVLEGLESLLNKSLLRGEVGLDGEPRFVMLELIHEYARERLEDSGEAEDIKHLHAMYFLALAERATPEFRGARYVYWSSLLRQESNNLRTALSWALGGGDVDLGLQLVGALRDYWWYDRRIDEAWAWTERALEKCKDAPPVLRAHVLNTAGAMCYYKADHKLGKTYNREAMEIFRELEDDMGTAWALAFQGIHSLAYPSDSKEGIRMLEEALLLFRKIDYKPGVTQSLIGLGEISRLYGDYEGAEKAYLEAIEVAHEVGNKLSETISFGNLSYVAYHRGDYKQAEMIAREVIELQLELENTRSIPTDIVMLAGAIAAQGNPEKAARLFGASDALLESMGLSVQPGDRFESERYESAVREQLDEITFESAWSDGRAMSLEQAVAYALEETD